MRPFSGHVRDLKFPEDRNALPTDTVTVNLHAFSLPAPYAFHHYLNLVFQPLRSIWLAFIFLIKRRSRYHTAGFGVLVEVREANVTAELHDLLRRWGYASPESGSLVWL